MSEAKTILIMGSYRGGTTAVTAAIMGLGAKVVTRNTNLLNLEDRPFMQMVHGVDKPNVRQIRKYINARNEQDDIWAVKYPAMHLTLLQYLHEFHNPHIVFVWRDPIAVAQSEYKRRLTKNKRQVIDRTMVFYRKMLGIADAVVCPICFISYENLLLNGVETIRKLKDWAGLPGEVSAALTMINKKDGYEGTKDRAQAFL